MTPSRTSRSTSQRRAYAGVGARETPPATLRQMEAIAAKLAVEGWTLRTGLSPGADQAFHRGALNSGGRVELYLPWRGFEQAARASVAARGDQDHPENHFFDDEMVFALEEPTADARRLAPSFHPAWQGLDEEERLLRSRDLHEILGARLRDPVAFVVCWTQDGSLDGASSEAGGTGQALRVARRHEILVFNLARPEHERLARSGRLGARG